MIEIAIQGVIGSFHDIAARAYFPKEEVRPICCETFEDVFLEMAEDSRRLGMMAIENTIAGSLLHNYELLRKSGAAVIGEYKLHVSHSIACLEDEDWDDLTEVNSHPVALMQCLDYLTTKSALKKVETTDTAGAAEAIARRRLRGHAAICHKEAARRYGLKILEEGIEDNKHNFTRFLLMADPRVAEKFLDTSKANKAALVFSLPHEEGRLSQVLSIFSFYKINLTKIQSLPIIGHEWEYLFYVDVTFDDYTRYRQSIEAVRPLLRAMKILGEYVGN